MSDGWRRILGEVGRFFAVGGLATFVSVALFNILVHGVFVEPLLEDHALTGYTIANTVGMVVSYHGTRGWVFPHRPPQHSDGGFTAYAIINFASMLLPLACLGLSRHVLGLDDPISDNVSANVIGMFLSFLARFYLFRRFVFRRPADSEPVVAG